MTGIAPSLARLSIAENNFRKHESRSCSRNGRSHRQMTPCVVTQAIRSRSNRNYSETWRAPFSPRKAFSASASCALEFHALFTLSNALLPPVYLLFWVHGGSLRRRHQATVLCESLRAHATIRNGEWLVKDGVFEKLSRL